MKFPIVFLISLGLFINTNAQEFDNYIWVVKNSKFYPITDSTSNIPEVNQIFRNLNVISFKKAEIKLPEDFISDSLFEIYCDCNENDLREAIIVFPEIYSYLIDFKPGSLKAVVHDSTALPSTDTTSFNDTLNSILEKYDVESYKKAFSSTLQVIITCKDCLWFKLLNEINETVPDLITSYPIGMQYPDGINFLEVKDDLELSVIPNPNNGVFKLKVQNECKDLFLEIYDSAGNLCLRKQPMMENAIDMSFFPPGFYVVVVSGFKDIIRTGLIIINK